MRCAPHGDGGVAGVSANIPSLVASGGSERVEEDGTADGNAILDESGGVGGAAVVRTGSRGMEGESCSSGCGWG